MRSKASGQPSFAEATPYPLPHFCKILCPPGGYGRGHQGAAWGRMYFAENLLKCLSSIPWTRKSSWKLIERQGKLIFCWDSNLCFVLTDIWHRKQQVASLHPHPRKTVLLCWTEYCNHRISSSICMFSFRFPKRSCCTLWGKPRPHYARRPL